MRIQYTKIYLFTSGIKLKKSLFWRFFYFRNLHKINKGLWNPCLLHLLWFEIFFFPPLFILLFWKYKDIFLPLTNFNFFPFRNHWFILIFLYSCHSNSVKKTCCATVSLFHSTIGWCRHHHVWQESIWSVNFWHRKGTHTSVWILICGT